VLCDGGWASLRRVSARARGGLAEGGEKSGWRSEPLPGQGVSRLSQARKRAKKALALACLIAICKYQECFPALRPTRTNCDYLAEIKRSLSRIHRSNGAIDTSFSLPRPVRTCPTDDSPGIRKREKEGGMGRRGCSRVPKYMAQRREVEKRKPS